MRKVILFCAATLFSLLSFAQESDADIVKVGDNIPAFTLHSTANGTINSADLKGKVVLINIFATWCGPCKMMKPILEELKNMIGDSATILKIDVDKNQAIASKYGIQSVPTLIIFKKGEIVWRQSGVMQAPILKDLLKNYK